MVRKINCRRCGVCSRTRKGIKLTPTEIAAIKGKARIEKTGQVTNPGRLPIDSKHMCVAFTTKGGKGHCKIYPVRPAICKQYPVIYFQGRVIIQRDCTAVKELLAEGTTGLSREAVEKTPFLAKSLRILDAEFPQAKRQKFFEITNA